MTSDNISMTSDNDSMGEEIESLRRKLEKLQKRNDKKKSSSPRATDELAPIQTQNAKTNGDTPNTLSDGDESSGGILRHYEDEYVNNASDSDDKEKEEEVDSMRAQGRPSSKNRSSNGNSGPKKAKRPSLGDNIDSKGSNKFHYLSKSTQNLGKRDSKQNVFDGESGRGSNALGENDSVCGMIGDSDDDSPDTEIDTCGIGQRRNTEIDDWVPLDAVHQQQLQEHIYRQQELYKQERPDDTEDLWDHPVAPAKTIAEKTNIATSGGSRSESSDEFDMEDVYKATSNNPLLRPGIPRHGSYRSTSNRTGSSNTAKPYQEVETLSRYSTVSYEIKSRKSIVAAKSVAVARAGKTDKHTTTRLQQCNDDEDDDDDGSFSSISSSERVIKSTPRSKQRNMVFDTSEMENQRKKHQQEMMTAKQRSSFGAIMPVKITPDGEATVASNTIMPNEEDDDALAPPFQQFSLMTANVENLSQDLADESKFHDAGPRYLDTFTLMHSETHFQDQFPNDVTNNFIDSQSLSTFCFPDGVKLRFFPRAAHEGAQRMGWFGKPADCCHVLVFTDSSGFPHYGVAITVREEYVPTSKSEKLGLMQSLRVRQKRRSAATKISRWWQKIVQYRVLTEALHISGFEYHTAADLKAELSQPEMQMLEKSLRHRQISSQDLFGGGIRRTQKAGDLQKRMKNQGIRKKLNRALSERGAGQEGQRKSSRELSNEAVTAVENVTRNAIMRSPSTKFADQQGSDVHTHQLNKSASSRVSSHLSEVDDDDKADQGQKKSTLLRVLERADRRSNKQKSGKGVSSRSMASGNRSQKSLGFRSLRSKKSVDKPFENDGGDQISASRSTRRSSSNGASIKSGLSTIKSSSTGSSSKSYSAKTIKRAHQAYESMKSDHKLGNMCVIEKCYVLVGCRPEQSVFLLGPLQQLVDYEREETHRRFRQMRNQQKRRSTDSTAALDERLKTDQDRNRSEILQTMMDKLRLTRKQAYTTFPMSELHHIQGRRRHFKTNLNIPDTPGIKLPLPLPDIGKQWGVAKLLLTIGSDSLLLAVKLLLLERSMLILGQNLEEITACACGLLSLLKPMEWASAFMPVLPLSLLGFVNSPVPFVAGVAVDDNYRLMEVETDERITQAMENGMSVINLHTNTLLITTETGVSQMLSLDPYLREQLDFLSTRLQHYAREKSSAIHSFPRFIRDGLSRKESVTMHSVSHAFEQHFVRYCGDLATTGNAWKRYGTIDVKTGNFNFYPAWFMNPIRADQFFHEALVHTQLFVGYVDERRRNQMEVDEMRKSEVGKFIANWIYEKWNVRKKHVFNEFVKRRGEAVPSERESEFATSTGRTG